MVSPDADAPAVVWRSAIGIVSVAGIVFAGCRAALVPWLLFLATRIAVTVLFFGYVRAGATAIPVIALLIALAVERWLRVRPSRFAVAVLAAGISLEAVRFVTRPVLSIDGTPVKATEVLPPDEHAEHRIEVN
jgi:hypothetical protein